MNLLLVRLRRTKTEKIDGGLFVTCGHTSIAFDFAEQILNKVALLVRMSVNVSLTFPACRRWYDCGHSLFFNGRDDVVRVVALVRDEILALRLIDELGSFGHVVNVSGGKVDMQ